MAKKYSEDQLTKAILLVIDDGLSPRMVAAQTGINLRSLQRYKSVYLGNDTSKVKKKVITEEVAVIEEVSLTNNEVQNKLNVTLLKRAKFLDDVIDTKQILLDQLRKEGKKTTNIDALQKSIKTLSDIEKEVIPDGDVPAVHAKTVNMFQFFNQKLIDEGYAGPKLTDADIVKGD